MAVQTQTNTVCPFCSLLCADVTVHTDGLAVRADDGVPPACQAMYRSASLDAVPEPRVAGQAAAPEAAVARAADILKRAKHPLFSGLGSDANAARAVMRLARRHHGTVDHANSARMLGAVGVAQNYGWIGGTLSEAAHRVDLFVVLGGETLAANPRYAETVMMKRPAGGKDAPRIVLVGDHAADDGAAKALAAYEPALIQMPDELLAHAVRYLNLLRRGAPVPDALAALFPDEAQLRQLHERLLAAKYSGIVWKSDVFGDRHADVAATSLARLIKGVNRTTRCVGLPLGGNAGEHTLNYVSLWHSGQPVCSSSAHGGAARHNPLSFNTARLLAQKRVDALFWVAPLTPAPAPNTDAATVFIGHPKAPLEREPEVFIPTGVPGVDHAGYMFRTDGVVTVRLGQTRAAGLPAASEVLRQIGAAAA